MERFSIWYGVVVLVVIGTVLLHKYKAIFLKYISTYAFKPVGIGGWLIVPIIGFFGTALLEAKNLVVALMIPEFRALVFDGAISGVFERAVLMSFVLGFAVILSAVWSLYFIFRFKSGVRQVVTIHYVLLAFACIIDIWVIGVLRRYIPALSTNDNGITTAASAIIGAVIWIQYFHMSKRVRNTFESPRNELAAASPKVGTE